MSAATLTLPLEWPVLTGRRRTCKPAEAVSAPARARKFDEFARTHEPMLYAMALKLTGNPADARDLVQDAFVRAIKAYEALPEGSNERGWIVTILHNLFIDQCRKRRNSEIGGPHENDAQVRLRRARAFALWRIS